MVLYKKFLLHSIENTNIRNELSIVKITFYCWNHLHMNITFNAFLALSHVCYWKLLFWKKKNIYKIEVHSFQRKFHFELLILYLNYSVGYLYVQSNAFIYWVFELLLLNKFTKGYFKGRLMFLNVLMLIYLDIYRYTD